MFQDIKFRFQRYITLQFCWTSYLVTFSVPVRLNTQKKKLFFDIYACRHTIPQKYFQHMYITESNWILQSPKYCSVINNKGYHIFSKKYEVLSDFITSINRISTHSMKRKKKIVHEKLVSFFVLYYHMNFKLYDNIQKYPLSGT